MFKASIWIGILSVVLGACAGVATAPASIETRETVPTGVSTISPTVTVRASATATLNPTPQPTATAPPTNPPEPTVANTPTPLPPGQSPTFINHPPPSYTVDSSLIEQLDCATEADGRRYCAPDSELGAQGCDEIQVPPDILGALEPVHPMVMCFVEPYRSVHPEPQAGSYLYRTGGLFGMYARLVIQRDGQLEVLHSEEEMAGAFAPIESPDEALAYAVAVTGLGPEYGLSHAPNFEYFTDVIEDTTVTEEGDGYLVRLFHFRLFGCGPHEMLEFDLHVSRAGVIEQRERTALYKDPAMDNLCVD